MREQDRAIDGSATTRTVLRKIRCADGAPGVLDRLFDEPGMDSDAHGEPQSEPAAPGRLIARRDEAVLRATLDGAVRIGHVRREDGPDALKLPTALAFPSEVEALPDRSIDAFVPADPSTWREIRYEAADGVGYLRFDFHNGAMSTAQCERLAAALRAATQRAERVLVLLGGADFWSNGLHLNVIETAESSADESWRNIAAIDDVTLAIIEATDRLVVAALQGNAGAGGVFLALAADRVWARHGVILNPHYKNMGNLHGSEYWTYLLPRRLRSGSIDAVMGHRLPMARAALPSSAPSTRCSGTARRLPGSVRDALAAWRPALICRTCSAKERERRRDEAAKPLGAHRRGASRPCGATSTASIRATTSRARTSCAGGTLANAAAPGDPSAGRSKRPARRDMNSVDLASRFTGLAAVVLLLGLRHGFDADHPRRDRRPREPQRRAPTSACAPPRARAVLRSARARRHRRRARRVAASRRRGRRRSGSTRWAAGVGRRPARFSRCVNIAGVA
jgi:hypothetical protein